MPNFAQDLESTTSIKTLVIGDSGSGKTGSLAALANAGYEVFVQDYDAGARIIRSFLKQDARERVHYVPLQDKLKSSQGKAIPKGVPDAVTRGLKLLDDWTDPNTGESFGPIADWTSDRVVVIDSLTFMGAAALRYVLRMNGRSGQHPQIQDWGQAMEMQEGMLQLLYSDDVKCNVIVNAHLTYIGDESDARGYPAALGSKLPPKIGRYFNNLVMLRTRGSGQSQKRFIRTVSEGRVELKNEAPQTVPAEIPLELDSKGAATGGLAAFFEAIRAA